MLTTNIFHKSADLHSDSGTFLRHYYNDAERVFNIFDSESWANQLLLNESVETARLFFREQIPVLHRDLFYPVTVKESDYRDGKLKILKYGGDVRYGDPVYYGIPYNAVAGAVELPDGVVDVECVCNLPVDPNIILIKGEHFEIKDRYLVFESDIFKIFAAESETITLWLRSAHSDRKYLQDRIGFLSKTTGQSTAEYKEFANLVIDAVVEGTSDKRLNQLIGIIFDTPVSKERETVQVIGVGEKERWLATDKNVYFTELPAEWTVKAGEVIKPGTFLTDGVLPITGRTLPDNVPIVFEKRFLGHTYQSGLVFDNKDVRLNTNPAEKHITFDITGQEADKRRFWDEMYERAADPMFLYNASSGGWINPAKFIYENILYPNCRLYVVKNKTLGKDKLPMSNTSVLRNLLPPGVIFSILFELNEAELEFEAELNMSGVCGYAYLKKNIAVDMSIGGATIKAC